MSILPNDNSSGVAAMLALARKLSKRKTDRTLRFVAFVNEEPPFFQTGKMGSRVWRRGRKLQLGSVRQLGRHVMPK